MQDKLLVFEKHFDGIIERGGVSTTSADKDMLTWGVIKDAFAYMSNKAEIGRRYEVSFTLSTTHNYLEEGQDLVQITAYMWDVGENT